MEPIGSVQALNSGEMFSIFHRQHVMKFYTKLDLRAHKFVQIFAHTSSNDILQSLIYIYLLRFNVGAECQRCSCTQSLFVVESRHTHKPQIKNVLAADYVTPTAIDSDKHHADVLVYSACS